MINICKKIKNKRTYMVLFFQNKREGRVEIWVRPSNATSLGNLYYFV